MTRGSDLIALAGRILLSAMFIDSGWGKMMAPNATIATFTHLGVPIPPVAYFVLVLVELVGGLLLLIGFRARWMALILAAWCVATALMVHYHPGDRAQMLYFWKNIALTGGFLQVVAWGAGRWSVDRR